jgi:signal transduction histidine kinase
MLAIQSRDDLLAVISHDLKNPITAAILNSELILRPGLSNETNARIRDIALSTKTALERASNLISGLLDLNKIEVGRLLLDKSEIDLKQLLEESVTIIRPLADKKRLKLDLSLSIMKNISISADRNYLMRVIANLLGNAIKFTPEGGKISIRTAKMSHEVRVSVQDSGPGICKEDLLHVFDRYWQAEATAKKGTGLGLAIAKGFVEAHGGKIWVESDPGHGAKFSFTIPLNRERPPKVA